MLPAGKLNTMLLRYEERVFVLWKFYLLFKIIRYLRCFLQYFKMIPTSNTSPYFPISISLPTNHECTCIKEG